MTNPIPLSLSRAFTHDTSSSFIAKIIVLVSIIVMSFFSINSTAEETDTKRSDSITIALLVPDNTAFWKRVTNMSLQAASDLNVQVQVYPFDLSPDKMREQAKKAMESGIDALIFQVFEGAELDVLALAEQHQTPSILINNRMSDDQYSPRKQFEYWLGSVTADDKTTGERLIRALTQRSRLEKRIQSHHVLALAGNPLDTSSENRIRGLNAYVATHPEVQSVRIENAFWSATDAAFVFEQAWKGNPNITEVWCASDQMAQGVADKIKEMGLTDPPIVGGIDWDITTAEYLKDERIAVSIGGHFMDGAWAVILLHDYLKGADFARQGLQFDSLMLTATPREMDRYSPFFQLNPRGMNFANQSMIQNQHLLAYDFNLRAILSLSENTQPLELTEEEQQWIANHPLILVGNETGWPPFDFVDEQGKSTGFSIELMDYIAKVTGLKIEYIKHKSWDFLFNATLRGQIDVLPAIYHSEKRQQELNFTQSYLSLVDYFYTRPNAPPVSRFSDVGKRRLVLVKGFAVTHWVKENYPHLAFTEKDTLLEALIAVSSGEADILIGNNGAVSYLLEKHFINNIKINGVVVEHGQADLHMATRKGAEPLVSILNKAINHLPDSKKSAMIYRWLKLISNESYTSEYRVLLTKEEREWLEEHPKIKLADDYQWKPFSYLDEQGDFAGIGASFVDEIGLRLGLDFIPQKGLSWEEVEQKLKDKELDVAPVLVHSEQREEFLHFTKPYVSFPVVISRLRSSKEINNLWGLKGENIGVIQGSVTHQLEQDHPTLIFNRYSSISEGFDALRRGEIVAMLDNLATVNYEIDQKHITDIVIAGATGYRDNIAMGVRKDWPELINILNKAIDAIDEKERNTIKNRWMRVDLNIGTNLATILWWAIPLTSGAMIIIGYISFSNRKLSAAKEQISIRTEQLEKANSVLKETLSELKRSQKQLIEQEKMASLGGLVAGVSHEINTPLGIAVTAISHVEHLISQLNERFDDNKVTKSFMQRFLQESKEGSTAASLNLGRAANLIKSFKNISMDHNDDSYRTINLAQYLQEVLLSLRPQLKTVAHEVRVDCPDDIVITTIPGAIAQILTNLVINALRHAFPNGESGILSIFVGLEEDWITLTFEDDGCGMNDEQKKHIFEPFYTTCLGSGGSGLGAHIIYNLATSALKGTIDVESQLGVGSRFIIRFPIHQLTAEPDDHQ